VAPAGEEVRAGFGWALLVGELRLQIDRILENCGRSCPLLLSVLDLAFKEVGVYQVPVNLDCAVE